MVYQKIFNAPPIWARDMSDRSLVREVIRISWPMIISELSDSLYSIADTFFVSKLGTAALAGVGIGSYLSWLFFVIIVPFSVGLLIYVAQSYGAKELHKARKAIGETIIYSLLVTFIVSQLVHYNSLPLISLIAGPSSEVIENGVAYFSMRILGLPLMATAFLMDSSLRAIGATKYSMVAILSSTTLNIVLDPILIFGLFGIPSLGVKGAALATVLSIAYLVPLEFFFLKLTGIAPIFSFKEKYVTKIIRLGTPTAIERAIHSIGGNVYIAFIARCGEVALAAHQIGIRIESFIYMPGFAFMVAASSLVGQRIGSGNIGEAKKVCWETAKVATAVMTLLGLIAAITSYYIVKPFSPTEKVAELAAIYLILAGLSEPGLALAMTLSGGIRGGGNTVVPMAINAVGLYSFRIIPAAILIGFLGVIGAWTAMFIDVYLRGIIFAIVFKKFFTKLARKVV